MEDRKTDHYPLSSETLQSRLGPVFFLTSIFFLNFLSRIILAPLLVTIEKELHLSHEEAGVLFLLISVGYSLSLIGSGHFSSRVVHRKAIFISALGVGATLLVLSLCHGLWPIRGGLFLMGMWAGIYLPSGIALLTSLVRPQDWGKAVAIHELAPNLSFCPGPLYRRILFEVGFLAGADGHSGNGFFAPGFCFFYIRPGRKFLRAGPYQAGGGGPVPKAFFLAYHDLFWSGNRDQLWSLQHASPLSGG
jgi:MFS family permease